MGTFAKAIALLSPRERRRGLLVLAMVVAMALLETIGIASVMPFFRVLGSPEAIENDRFISALYDGFNFESRNSFLVALGVGAFCVILVSSCVRVATTYAINRYVQMRRHSLSERLLENYLRQPYEFFLNRHSSDMAKSILSEVDQVTSNVIKPGLDAVAYSVVATAIISLLVLTNPWLALGAGVIVGGSYVLIYVLVQSTISRLGRDRAIANGERFAAAGEALGGIKDIKLLGREHAYLSRFRPSSERLSLNQATNNTLSEVPRYLIEAIGVGGLIALALVLMLRAGDFGDVLPILGLYAFAGYKLLPAAQRIYSGAAMIRFGAAALEQISADLSARERAAHIDKKPPPALSIHDDIRLEALSYSYPMANRPALKNVTLKIPKGSSLGLVGGTGAGKTTLVDIILGLLPPSAGKLLVDGEPIQRANLRTWQRTLGYVPQDIFLADASVAQNIAFGVSAEDIDHKKVETCARMAQIHGVIADQLEHGYDTFVGERGVRLSGGQRQRIGIARALYHDPEVLVFDEATSALDNATERALMQAVDALSQEKTVVLIAHRLTTVRNCDQIAMLEDGEIVARGTYDALLAESDAFRRLAG